MKQPCQRAFCKALQASPHSVRDQFLDKSIIEVFVNDRVAALAPHVYAAENQGVSLFTDESSMYVKEFVAWKLRSSYGNLRNEVTQ